MPRAIKFHVLDVGQGNGTFVEVFNNGLAMPPTHAVLVDFGSEKSKDIAGPPAIKFVTDRLKAMATPTLHSVFLSHSDSDHWNLVPDLLKDAAFTGTTISKVFYGCNSANYTIIKKKGGKKIRHSVLKDLQTYGVAKTDILPMADAYTNFNKKDTTGQWPTFDTLGGWVNIRVLVANCPTPTSTASGKKRKVSASGPEPNTQSIVLVVECAGKRILLTGDATATTLAWINAKLNKSKAEDQVDNTFMLEVPHHGSAVTIVDNTSATPWAAAEKLVSLSKPNSVSASADFHRGFKHPDVQVIDKFSAHAGTGGYTPPATERTDGQHTYCAFDDRHWYVFDADDNVYTTMYTFTQRVGWEFTVKDDATVSTERIPATALTAPSPAQIRAFVEARRHDTELLASYAAYGGVRQRRRPGRGAP